MEKKIENTMKGHILGLDRVIERYWKMETKALGLLKFVVQWFELGFMAFFARLHLLLCSIVATEVQTV